MVCQVFLFPCLYVLFGCLTLFIYERGLPIKLTGSPRNLLMQDCMFLWFVIRYSPPHFKLNVAPTSARTEICPRLTGPLSVRAPPSPPAGAIFCMTFCAHKSRFWLYHPPLKYDQVFSLMFITQPVSVPAAEARSCAFSRAAVIASSRA